jgi:hypothetical protein
MIEGGCNCGQVRYRIDGAPLAVAACHCTRCRRQSGSIYSVNLIVPLAQMSIEGELSVFEDTDTTSGAPVYREFCGACGSPIRSRLGANPTVTAVKVGTLDDPEPFAPALHVFTRSKIGWVQIPAGTPQFETSPG